MSARWYMPHGVRVVCFSSQRTGANGNIIQGIKRPPHIERGFVRGAASNRKRAPAKSQGPLILRENEKQQEQNQF